MMVFTDVRCLRWISSARAVKASFLRPWRIRSCPFWAKRSAKAAPIPLVAPVMRARGRSTDSSMGLFLLLAPTCLRPPVVSLSHISTAGRSPTRHTAGKHHSPGDPDQRRSLARFGVSNQCRAYRCPITFRASEPASITGADVNSRSSPAPVIPQPSGHGRLGRGALTAPRAGVPVLAEVRAACPCVQSALMSAQRSSSTSSMISLPSSSRTGTGPSA